MTFLLVVLIIALAFLGGGCFLAGWQRSNKG